VIYNHYVVRKGLNAPNVKAMAEVNRPEGFVHDDDLGFGTLCYTLDAAASPYPAAPAPTAPVDLKATASVGKVWLRWLPVYPLYEDTGVIDGATYYYVVSLACRVGA
jgi:hypothetical protein